MRRTTSAGEVTVGAAGRPAKILRRSDRN
jgi:hypothetical protein